MKANIYQGTKGGTPIYTDKVFIQEMMAIIDIFMKKVLEDLMDLMDTLVEDILVTKYTQKNTNMTILM